MTAVRPAAGRTLEGRALVMTKTPNFQRWAFTLIEMLVVLVIIALLVGLLLAGLSRAIKYGNQVKAITELHELEAAIQNFQNKNDVNFIPSQIKLNAVQSTYGTTQLDIDSLNYLQKLFPKMFSSTASPFQGGGTGYVKWTYNPAWSSSAMSVVLEGHQSLVFFLGGIQTSTTTNNITTYGCAGFSTNSQDPSDNYTSTIKRTPPFFEFNNQRLIQYPANSNSGSSYLSMFLSYADPISNNTTSTTQASGPQPYAYFSSYGNPGGYNRTNTNYTGYGTTYDNPTLGISGGAYSVSGSSPILYLNPNSFQILCSGFDGRFGPGGAWMTNGSTSTPGPSGNFGFDDLSNFTPGPLGAGQ